MYRRIIKPILFGLSIESAHRAAMSLLRTIGAIPGGKWLLHKFYAVENPKLEREVFGLKFKNPIGLAAGFDRNGEAFNELAALGFGFIEIGTVTPRPQHGNPRPRVFRLPKDEAIVSRIGLANKGLERTISNLRHPHKGIIIGCNLGYNTTTLPQHRASDYLKSFRNLYQYADYFTINVCSDNYSNDASSQSRASIISVLEPLFDFRRGQNHYRPILLKISPDLSNELIDEITDIMMSTPLDGIVATNGTYQREGLLTGEDTITGIGNGRLSGRPLRARAIEVVQRIHTRSNGSYPIIGVGGVMTPDDALAMLRAGASLVQIYTGCVYHGPHLIREICNEIVKSSR